MLPVSFMEFYTLFADNIIVAHWFIFGVKFEQNKSSYKPGTSG